MTRKRFRYKTSPPKAFCPVTGKTSYSSKDRARKAMVGCSTRLRAYLCKHCNHWHLTSQVGDKEGRDYE